MKIDLRQPMINGNDKEQLAQIRSYLFQLRDTLQWAFENVESSESTTNSTTTTIVHNNTQTITRPPTAEEAESTFAAIKNLIIKSADIVDAYYTDISGRLLSSKTYVLTDSYNEDKVIIDDGIKKNEEAFEAHQKFADEELAHSKEVGMANADAIKENANNFNVFREVTEAAIRANADNINIEHTKIETLQNVFQDDKQAAFIRKSTGYIKTGFLSDNEYGVEVGQSKDGKDLGSARFTPGKISFYEEAAYSESNAEPSAWLSNRRLHASEVEAVDRQQIGGFVDIVDKSTGDVTTRWVAKED